MTKLQIYTIIVSRCILLLLGFLVAIPVWIINVFSLCLEYITRSYLTALFSFVSATKEVLTHFDKQLNNENK